MTSRGCTTWRWGRRPHGELLRPRGSSAHILLATALAPFAATPAPVGARPNRRMSLVAMTCSRIRTWITSSPVDAASTGRCAVAEARRLRCHSIAAQLVHGIDCPQQCGGIETLGSQFVPIVVGDADCHVASFLVLGRPRRYRPSSLCDPRRTSCSTASSGLR